MHKDRKHSYEQNVQWMQRLFSLPRTRTQETRRRRVSRISLASGKRRCRVLDETKKIVSGQPADVWQWPLTVCLLHFDTNLSNLIVKKIQC